MTGSRPRALSLGFGVYLAVSAVTAVAAGVVMIRRIPARRPSTATGDQVAVLVPAAQPIAAEAEVLRTYAGVLAIPPSGARQRDAHPRTLARFRFLRAYPGAPPRIPHGFTADEFRTGACNTCHERGGYSPRFGAYVPVTPHPDMPACLQCHVGNDAVTGVTLPNQDPTTVCRQCHAPGAGRWGDATVDWRPMAWPILERRAGNHSLPSIPHALVFRTNCLACHSGPSAVAEIRTTHPERASCRQCHVEPDPALGEFVRPGAATPRSPAGG
jgi:cytochrome c-type protein NapB